MYPWPIGNFDYVMDDALDIALNYLTLTGQAVMFQEVQSTAATAIAAAWRGGVRRRIRLASLMPRSKRSKVRKPDRFSNNRIAAAALSIRSFKAFERCTWKWSASIANMMEIGQAVSRGCSQSQERY